MNRLLAVIGCVALLSACMEVQQTADPTSARSQQVRKTDGEPWNNEPLASGPKWKKGDRASWEAQIRSRQLAQHEDRRIQQ